MDRYRRRRRCYRYRPEQSGDPAAWHPAGTDGVTVRTGTVAGSAILLQDFHVTGVDVTGSKADMAVWVTG